MDQPDNESETPAEGEEDLVAQCLDQFLAQLTGGAREIEVSSLESAAPPHVRARISRAKVCVAALESAATNLLTTDSTTGGQRASAAAPQKSRIGRFHVRSELGSGGFGIVYLAWDPRIDRDVALKIPRFEVLASVELEQRFEQEARAAARLDHPNIVSVLEAGNDGLLPYIASSYYPGVTLAAWLRDHREPINSTVVARTVQQLALALAHAHAHGVLHRDVKPSNVLLAPLDERITTDFALDCATPRLMDFGLAKLASDNHEMTKSGAMLGTLRYMPPEQASGRTKDIGPASDVYSLGAVLYELLTGQSPFAGASDVEVLRKIATEEPSRIRQSHPQTPVDLETIALKCLEKDPARRYASAQLLADDLDRFLHNIPITARPASSADRLVKWTRRNPQLTTFLGIAFIALIGFVAFLLQSNATLSSSLQETAQERSRAEEQALLAAKREQTAREYAYGSDMRLAQEAWDRSMPQEAQELLDRYIPRNGQSDTRGMEWRYLWNSVHRYSQVIAEQPSPVWSLAVEPKQGLFATADRQGVIRLWSLDPPKLIRELRGHETGDIDCLLFTPDGETLISAGNDHTIRFWRVADGKPLKVWNEHKDWIGALAISSWGTWLASGDAEGRVLLWNLDKDEFVGEQYRQSGAVRKILFRPTTTARSDSWLVSTSEGGEIRVWDYLKRSPPDELPAGKLEFPTFCFPMTFAANGNTLYAVSRGQMLLWDFRPENYPCKLVDQFKAASAVSLAVDSYGEYLLAGGDDSQTDIFVRSTRQIEEVARVLRGHADCVRGLATLPDANYFLSGSDDGTVRKWQIDLSDASEVQHKLGAPVDALAWSSDSRSFVVGLHTGELLLFTKPFNQAPVLLGRHQKAAINAIAISADQREMVAVDDEGGASRWRLDLRTQTDSFQVPLEIKHIALTDSGRTLVYAEKAFLVAVDARNGEARWRTEQPAEINSIAAHDSSLMIPCYDGVLRSVDASTGKLLRETQPQRHTVREVSFSRDGRRMVTGGWDKTIRIYDAQTFAEERKFSHPGYVQSVFFIHNDERLLVCEGNAFTIMNPATGQVLLKIPNQNQRVDEAKASPDGSLVAVPRRNELVIFSLIFE